MLVMEPMKGCNPSKNNLAHKKARILSSNTYTPISIPYGIQVRFCPKVEREQ